MPGYNGCRISYPRLQALLAAASIRTSGYRQLMQLAQGSVSGPLTDSGRTEVDSATNKKIPAGRRTWGFLLLTGLFLLQLGFFSYVALHRFIDGDEGFYLLASRLVLLHKKPYIDFLFEQAPLFPYAYAFWMKCFGLTWTSARLFAALLTAVTGTLLFEDICHQTRHWLAGLCGTIMFAASMLIFGFFPVAKTFSLAALLVFSAYVVVNRLASKSSSWLAAGGGVLLALSIDTRSYLVVVVPLFILWIMRSSEAKDARRLTKWFLAGCAVGILPCLYFFLSSPDAFLFNNLGYHAIRSNGGLVGMWEEKIVVLLQLFLMGPESNGLQNGILFFTSIGLLSATGKRRYPPRFAFQIAIAVGLVSLLPTPAWPQYFSLCVPFLLVTAVCTTDDMVCALESRRGRTYALAGCTLLFCVYLAAGVPDFHRYLVTGKGVPGIKSAQEAREWKLQPVVEVSRAIEQIASPGETVASLWPGYIFQTRTEPFPGLEADYAVPIADKLSAAQRRKYHVVSPADLERSFAAHTPRVVVVRDKVPSEGSPEWQKLRAMEDSLRNSVRENGYTVAQSVGGVSIYVYHPR